MDRSNHFVDVSSPHGPERVPYLEEVDPAKGFMITAKGTGGRQVALPWPPVAQEGDEEFTVLVKSADGTTAELLPYNREGDGIEDHSFRTPTPTPTPFEGPDHVNDPHNPSGFSTGGNLNEDGTQKSM
jgi:hypothetical protein